MRRTMGTYPTMVLVALAASAAVLPGIRPVAAASPADTDAVKSVSADYRAIEAIWNDWSHFTSDRLFTYYDPQYAETNLAGEVKGIPQLRLDLAEAQKRIHRVTMKFTLRRTELHGDTLLVWEDQHIEEEANTPDAGVFSPVTVDAQSLDTWKRTGNGWKIVASKDLPQKVADGQPNLRQKMTPAEEHIFKMEVATLIGGGYNAWDGRTLTLHDINGLLILTYPRRADTTDTFRYYKAQSEAERHRHELAMIVLHTGHGGRVAFDAASGRQALYDAAGRKLLVLSDTTWN